MKRAKQVQIMVDAFNEYLKNSRVIDSCDTEVSMVIHLLLVAKCYKGFNWFYEDEYTDEMGKVTKIQRLVGSGDATVLNERDAYIQLY